LRWRPNWAFVQFSVHFQRIFAWRVVTEWWEISNPQRTHFGLLSASYFCVPQRPKWNCRPQSMFVNATQAWNLINL
jgi:hypothetical protein